MRGRDRFHVEHFAVGRQPAMEIAAVPRGQALGAIVLVLFRHIHAAADHVGLADAVGAAALGRALAFGDDARAGADAVARVDLARQIAGGAIGQGHAAKRHRAQAQPTAKLVPPPLHPPRVPRLLRLTDPRWRVKSFAPNAAGSWPDDPDIVAKYCHLPPPSRREISNW